MPGEEQIIQFINSLIFQVRLFLALSIMEAFIIFIILLTLYMTEPAWELFKNRLSMRKKPFLLIVRSNRRAELKPAKYFNSLYLVKNKNGGEVYLASPDSSYSFKGAGTSIAIAFERYGPTISKKVVEYATVAKKHGINNIDEAEGKNLVVKNKVTGDVIRAEDVIGFFKYAFSPVLSYQAAVQIAESQRRKNAFNIGMIVTFLIIFVIAMIAVMFFMRSGSAVGGHTVIPPIGRG